MTRKTCEAGWRSGRKQRHQEPSAGFLKEERSADAQTAACHLIGTSPDAAEKPYFVRMMQIGLDLAPSPATTRISIMKIITTLQSMWRAVSRLLPVAALIAATQTSCVHQSTLSVSPSCSAAKIASMRSFYVRQHSEDNYKLAETITGELQKMGYTATYGAAQSSPNKVDAVVTYMDRWMWDITMYMLSLDVQLREPGTDMTLATAKTTRTSLVRKSQQEMSRETLAKLLGKEAKP